MKIPRFAAMRLAFVLLLFVASFNGTCDKVPTAVYGASVTVGEAVDIKRDLAQQGELSKEDDLKISRDLFDGNAALIQVTDTAECFTNFTSDAKQNVLNGFDVTVKSLDNLNDQDALRIKNQKARDRFRQKIFFAKLTVTGIRAAVALIPAKDPAANEQPARSEAQQRQLERLRTLCRKAGEQLRRNESALLDDIARLEGRNPEK